jgi:Na+-transporting methylmalonyl-CoA/oxaloacetate decarboxylase beta subunit
MKKLISMIALAAISYGSVYAIAAPRIVKPTMQTDTTKKKKPKKTRDTTNKKKKDTMVVKH